MINYIQIMYSLFTNLFSGLLFCFIYIPLFNGCNIKNKIKKNGKTKVISQPKSILAFIYLVLLFFLFKCFTFKIILFMIIIIIIGSLIMVDKLSSTIDKNLYKYNKSPIMIFCWKLLHSFFTIINIITEPLFSIINSKINKKLSLVKNFITNVANLSNSDDLNNDFENEFKKMNEEISNISDYMCKTKSKCEKNKINEKIIELNNEEESINDINTNSDNKINSFSTSKLEMEKKIDEINNVLKESNDDCIEDMTLTITENKN